MLMSYRLRRMLSVLVLLVALPIYVVVVISVMAWFVATNHAITEITTTTYIGSATNKTKTESILRNL